MSSHSIHSIVERQGRRWARSLEHVTRSAQPTVAIARLRYSGAHKIAEQVAAQLGYAFFANEIVDEIAKDEGVQRDLVAGLDERVQNAVERYVIDGFRPHRFEESDYVRALTRVVSTIASRGNAVILGRGATEIVDPAAAIRVLVIAPMEWRASRLAEMREIPIEKAREQITTDDKQRFEFYRRSFHFDHADPLHYDMVVNSGSLGLELSAATIVAAFQHRFRP